MLGEHMSRRHAPQSLRDQSYDGIYLFGTEHVRTLRLLLLILLCQLTDGALGVRTLAVSRNLLISHMAKRFCQDGRILPNKPDV